MIAGGALLPQNSWFKIRQAGRGRFCMVARQPAGWLLVLYLVAGMGSTRAQTTNSVPTAETIIARMAQARAENRARLRPYIVTRNYKLFGKDESKAKSEVIADVAFVPPDSKKYTIAETNGSGLGQILVRRMLANEAEVTKDYVSTDISADNYEFRFLREEDASGQRCYVLELLPKRVEKHLLRGDIWVDASTYLLRRFEGELAKPPSWWVRDVSVTFVYGEVGGMWLQTATEAAADVRKLGHSMMVSRDVKYKIDELVATASSAQTNLLELIPRGPFRPGAIPRPAK
jgi:outer membrane lipoprotein-sorting protein